MLREFGGALFAATLSISPVAAQDGSDFYAGKQIDLYVGFNPGGTYDLYSRLAAEWLPKYIEGNPTIVVQNMPGAGGTLAANYLYAQGDREGLEIGVIGQASALQQVIKKQGVAYDVTEFSWLGRFTPFVEMTAVWQESSPVSSIEDAKSTAVVLGGTSAGATAHMMPTVMNSVAGTQFEVVLGYKGTTGAVRAMESGETQGAHTTAKAMVDRSDWLDSGQVAILVQYAPERHPDFPDVPAMTEFGETEEDKQILALFASTAEIGRALMAPPGVPEERITILRDAFAEMINDPEFQTMMAERNLDFQPLTGDDLQARIERAVNIPDPVIDRVMAIQNSATN